MKANSASTLIDCSVHALEFKNTYVKKNRSTIKQFLVETDSILPQSKYSDELTYLTICIACLASA